MDLSSSLQLSLELGIGSNHRSNRRFRVRSSTIFWYSTSNYRFLPLFSESSHFKLQNSKASGKLCVLRTNLSSFPLNQQQYSWSRDVSKKIRRRVCTIPSRNHLYKCRCFLNTGPFPDANCLKNAALTLTGPFKCLQGLQNPLVIKLSSAVGIFIFAIWGLGPLIRQSRNILLKKNDSTWKRSSTYHVTTSYIQPLLLWVAAISICRALDPIIVPTEAGQVVKQRVLHFVRSISTVLAFARCFSSVIEQAQKLFMETSDPTDSVNMGFQFSGRAVYTAVWVAAVSLFMELLGFSTQKWITAGGFGTVLLTLAGREIFTNFLSSVMIHATRPFVLNEWIQTKIQGYDVSGTVEHVGWWSPTIIRGDDREAVHIPNNKFTVNIVRNLSQKTHWRIKTHLAISHLDVGKIHIIVADMRKVLAKNPHVEQQKLHRRVFFDKVNPENQALLILVSCFVKTSRFEEYLSVKEAILLDLLRVISHHRARLATPIRTIQKIYRDPNLDSVPFSDSMFTWGTTSDRPYMLIEPPYKINGEDKTKTQARSANSNVDEDAKATPRSINDPKPDAKDETTLKTNAKSGETEETQALDAKPGEESGQRAKVTDPKITYNAKKSKTDTQNTYNNKPDEGSASTSESKPDVRTRSSLEENILLGVALEGSKRTLPIDEDISDAEDTKKMSPLRSSNGPRLSDKDKSGNLQDQN